MKSYRFTWFIRTGGFVAVTVSADSGKNAIAKGKREILSDYKQWYSKESFSPSNYLLENA